MFPPGNQAVSGLPSDLDERLLARLFLALTASEPALYPAQGSSIRDSTQSGDAIAASPEASSSSPLTNQRRLGIETIATLAGECCVE